MENKNENTDVNNFNAILLYTTPNGKVKVEIYLQNDTVWLIQQRLRSYSELKEVLLQSTGVIFLKHKNLSRTQCVQKLHILPHKEIKKLYTR